MCVCESGRVREREQKNEIKSCCRFLNLFSAMFRREEEVERDNEPRLHGTAWHCMTVRGTARASLHHNHSAPKAFQPSSLEFQREIREERDRERKRQRERERRTGH